VPGPTLRVLFLNTYLLRAFEAEIGRRRLTVGSKPRIRERAEELGRALQGEYDVLVLAELFDERELRSLLAAWPESEQPRVQIGPVSTAPGVLQTSGLVTIVDQSEVGRVAVRGYRERGSRLFDADAWAEKGALLCEVAIGGTTIEVTSTHLIAGGGLLPRPSWPGRTASRVRDHQIEELRTFVDDHHESGNLQLVLGDLNVPASHPDGTPTEPYHRLCARFDGLDDLWCRDTDRGPGPTADIVEGTPAFTPDDDPCFYRDGPLDPADRRVEGPPAERIDYAFGSPGIEVVAMRRRRLPRPDDAAGLGEIDLMSDHAGLNLELRLDPQG
jgi:endonuclease/exonuclease/phosphatase family metal-dependent hydrolase